MRDGQEACETARILGNRQEKRRLAKRCSARRPEGRGSSADLVTRWRTCCPVSAASATAPATAAPSPAGRAARRTGRATAAGRATRRTGRPSAAGRATGPRRTPVAHPPTPRTAPARSAARGRTAIPTGLDLPRPEHDRHHCQHDDREQGSRHHQEERSHRSTLRHLRESPESPEAGPPALRSRSGPGRFLCEVTIPMAQGRQSRLEQLQSFRRGWRPWIHQRPERDRCSTVG